MKRSIYSPKQVFPASLRLAGEACREKRPGKGRPPIYPKRLYVALWLFRVYFALPYRAVEPMLQDRFPDLPCPRFPAWRWFLQTKVSWALLQRLFQRLKQPLSPWLPQEEPVLWALDASGFSYRAKSQGMPWHRGKRLRGMRAHTRLCVVIRYFPKARRLLIEAVQVGPGYASDAKLGRKALAQGDLLPGTWLADAGFDAGPVFEQADRAGLPATIRRKRGGVVRHPHRRQAQERFDRQVYRLRAVAEGVFGGRKTRQNGPFHELLDATAMKRTILEVICYNLRFYLSLFVFLLRRLFRHGTLTWRTIF